jgi:hypothetical protein
MCICTGSRCTHRVHAVALRLGMRVHHVHVLLCVQHISRNNCFETKLNLLLMAMYFYFTVLSYVL